jgi:hypothetical protein
MQGQLRVAAFVLAFLALVGPVRGGIYVPDEIPLVSLGKPYRVIDAIIGNLRGLPTLRTEAHPDQDRYKKRIARLEQLQTQGLLKPIDRVNLSGSYLQLFDPRIPGAISLVEKAIRVLNELPVDARDFMAWANLATAYHLTTSVLPPGPEQARALVQAQMAQEQALKAWPASDVHFDAAQLTWFLRAERYYLELLRRRGIENAKKMAGADRREPAPRERRGRAAAEVSLDDLFPGIPCRGANGEYCPGPLEPKAAELMPVDAQLIVAQLALWLPFDDRLFWLLGEVANARDGDYELAAEVLTQLDHKRNFSVPELRGHRMILLQARDVRNTLEAELRADGWQRANRLQSQNSLAALHGALPPGVGGVLAAATWPATIDTLRQDPSPAPPPPGAPALPLPPVRTGPVWRDIGIGFAIGVVASLLVALQVRQILRRRMAAREHFHVGVRPRG